MNKWDLLVEEMNYFGAAKIGRVVNSDEVQQYYEDLMERKKQDIDKHGIDKLREFDLETVRDLGRFGEKYFDLIENPVLNDSVNILLNDKAVLHSYNGIITYPHDTSGMLGFEFHRDQPFFGDVRTSIIVMIPLVDYSKENGATEYLPSSHGFKDIPSLEFQERHATVCQGKAGEAFIVDASTWHRAGVNSSDSARPMIVLKYTLAPFKQQIDFCKSAAPILDSASDLVKQRLGWDVRMCETYEEFRVPGKRRKFKSGQYDMTNTYIKRN